jgi:ABC-type nitrate/sulfonate/bicarbonate transport system, permease component
MGVFIDNARMLGASQAQLVRHVRVPSALTWIFSSLHISSGMTIIAVVVEYLGASRGIGYLIAQAEGVFDTTGVFAAMVVAAWVLVVGSLIGRLERRRLRWKFEYVGSRTDRFASTIADRVSSIIPTSRTFTVSRNPAAPLRWSWN